LSTVFRHCPPFATSRVHAIALPRSSVHFHAIAVQFSALCSMPLLQYSLRSSPLPNYAMQMPLLIYSVLSFRIHCLPTLCCCYLMLGCPRCCCDSRFSQCCAFALRCDASPFRCCESRSKPLLIPESYTQTYPCLHFSNIRCRAEHHNQATR
jgi:hypothetical protein